jgi:hypothetical protein
VCECASPDPYVYELIVAYGRKGIVTPGEYADSYYRYTRTCEREEDGGV